MVVHLQHVTYSIRKKVILQDITWDVKKGEHWFLFGLNGSGKTTLLNLVNGYIWPSKGMVNVLGQEFGKVDLRELRKSIGWVSSSLQDKLYMRETVLEIVLSGLFASIGLFNEVTPEETQRALALLEEVKIPHLAERLYETLSQGEKQKVLLARALISSPPLLILDEPCNGLDVFARELLLDTIQEIGQREDAPTLFFVSHHVEEIMPIFGKTLLLKEGKIFSQGNTREVVTGESMSRFLQYPSRVQWIGERAYLQLCKE